MKYKRIMDIKEPTFDSLEMLCNVEAQDGWEIVTISDGSLHRYATLKRKTEILNDTTTTSEDSKRSRLPIESPPARTGNAVVKTRTSNNPKST